MAMKEYSTLLQASEFEAYNQIQFNVLPRTPFFGNRSLAPLKTMQSEYSKPTEHGKPKFET